MSSTYDRVSKHVLNSKQDVEARRAKHNYECNLSLINAQMEIASQFLNIALDRIEAKNGR